MRFRSYKKILSKSMSGLGTDADWKKSSRDALLARIRQTTHWQEPEQSRSFGSIFSAMIAPQMLKPVLAGFLIFALTGSGSVFAVSAAKAALPGDALYSVKLGIEDVRVGLVFSEEKKASLEVQFAGARLKEVKQVIEEQSQPVKEAQKNIKKAIEEFNDNLGSVQKRLEKIEKAPKSDEKVLKISKLVNEKTTELESDLLEIKEKIVSKDAEAEIESVSEPGVSDAATAQNKESELQDSSEELSLEEDAVSIEQTKANPDNTAEQGNASELSDVSDNADQNGKSEQSSNFGNNKESSVSIETEAVNKDGETSSQETERQGKELLETLELALTALDGANTKSLEVFVEKALKSENKEVKQNAVDKLQSKIEKVEKRISDTEEKIVKITEKTAAQNFEKESIDVASSTSSESSKSEKSPDTSSGKSAPEQGANNQDSSAVEKDDISSTTPETLIKIGETRSKDNASVKETVKSEQKPIKEAIEQAQGKPQQAKETINEVKKILNEKTEELSNVVEKLNQAKAMVKEAEQNNKNVEEKIDQKAQEVKQETKKNDQATQNAPSSIVPNSDNTQSAAEPAKDEDQSAKSFQSTDIENLS